MPSGTTIALPAPYPSRALYCNLALCALPVALLLPSWFMSYQFSVFSLPVTLSMIQGRVHFD
jgi:hypothetical protein